MNMRKMSVVVIAAVAAGVVLLSSCGGGDAWLDDFTETAGDANIEMAFVKGGTFTMGCTPEQENDCYNIEKPAHRVTVSDFHIGRYEVTQRQWAAVMGENRMPSRVKRDDDMPIYRVTWNDIQEFIARLNELSGKQYRLPTEAEWEFAARGGNWSARVKFSGSNDVNRVAWHHGNSGGGPHPVGGKEPNELRLYDMSGNVSEYVGDLFEYYTDSAKTNPTGGAPSENTRRDVRISRGGHNSSDVRNCRVSDRSGSSSVFTTPGLYGIYNGFRLALGDGAAEQGAALAAAAKKDREERAARDSVLSEWIKETTAEERAAQAREAEIAEKERRAPLEAYIAEKDRRAPVVNVLQHIDFSPRGSSIHGTDISDLRVWGWSRDGLFAYSTDVGDCCSGMTHTDFVIMNLINDRTVFELSYSEEGYYGNDSAAADANATRRLNMSRIEQALASNGIVSQEVSFLPFPLKKDDATYNAAIQIVSVGSDDDYDNAGPWNPPTTYRVVINKNGGQSKTIRTFRNIRRGLRFEIGGYFMSPFENRALVVIIREQYTHGGSGVYYEFSGFHLETGFR